ncbi:MAG: hypothetical protein P8L90_04790 [Flavobacteriaceae bacterium]|nr:hypothetical protein [Flavobacteriaceae bacterium]MDC0612756.1 hypothetical protein [bacterium]MDG1051774.1 hypothetical protein [Flavobacteriaceae bacterium]MDG2368482.1 hypothetical protein [Flavobacteriaceae bacterium]
MRKYFVLTILFVLPLVVYLFFASGINHFAKLPILTKDIKDISVISSESFNNKITILGFFGSKIQEKYGDAGNLNQEIFKRFNEFKDFQFLMIQPLGTKSLSDSLLFEMNRLTKTNFQNWKFVEVSDKDLLDVFESLKTDLKLDSSLATSYVFIIDRDGNLRGRDDEEGIKYGYDSRFVADINNNMVDDVKVILAEYRMALKKNNIYKNEL